MSAWAEAPLAEHVCFVHAADGFRLALTEVAWGRPPETGPVFLLVPGFAQNRAAFLAGDLPRLLLERGARVLVGELRGHGRSVAQAGDRARWSLRTHLREDLPALVARARGEDRAPVHFVGHSMGGMLGVAALSGPLAETLASVTTFAAPLAFHGHSPLVRLAGLAAVPILRAVPSVRMDLFLGALAPLLIARGERTRLRALLEVAALASARTADARVLAQILASSERESAVVLGELAEMAVRGRAVLDGVDLLEVMRGSLCPIASVIGPYDVLAPRSSLVDSSGARGPRQVIEIPDALHVDLVVGRHAKDLVDRLWSFLVSA